MIPLAHPKRTELVTLSTLPALTKKQLGQINAIQAAELQKPQIKIFTKHVLHAGLYSRTVTVSAGIQITGCLVKIPTLVVVSGDCWVNVGDAPRRLTGHHVLTARGHRKQAFQAIADTAITMIFATKAKTVDQAEKEFTDEWRMLASARDPTMNETIIGA